MLTGEEECHKFAEQQQYPSSMGGSKNFSGLENATMFVVNVRVYHFRNWRARDLPWFREWVQERRSICKHY